MSIDEFKRMGKPALEKSDINVRDATGGKMAIQGKLKCDFNIRGVFGSGYAYITPRASLMGLEWIQQNESMAHYLDMMIVCKVEKELSLVDELKTKFSPVFEEGLGRCVKEKAELVLQSGAKPVYIKKRPTPHAAVETVEKELDRLIGMQVDWYEYPLTNHPQ